MMLKLYLVPEINAATKLQNANTRKLAEQIKAQRILDIQREGLVDWDRWRSHAWHLPKWMGWLCEVQWVVRVFHEDQAKHSCSHWPIPITYRQARVSVATWIRSFACMSFAKASLLEDLYLQWWKETTEAPPLAVCSSTISIVTSKGGKGRTDWAKSILAVGEKEKPQKRVAEREFLTMRNKEGDEHTMPLWTGEESLSVLLFHWSAI